MHDFGHCLDPLGGILGQHAEIDLFERVRDIRANRLQRRDRLELVLEHDRHQGFPLIGRPVQQQKVERRPEAVNIRAMIDLSRVDRLFGRHVIHGAENRTRLRDRSNRLGTSRAREARQPQIGNLDGPRHVAEQVGGLDVTMDQPLIVRVLQAAGCLQ